MINLKYIERMMKHGYTRARELATYAAVNFQWDATSDVMEDWMYETYAKKYTLDLRPLYPRTAGSAGGSDLVSRYAAGSSSR